MVDKITLPLVPDPIRPSGAQPGPRPASQPAGQPNVPDFATVLRREAEANPVRFSNHAEARLRTRDIQLSPTQQRRLDLAVDAAERKGSRESLILVDDLALVVSVRDRTVITAMDADSRKPNVFTHIDSAVLA
jgi:flagellar operon protein